MPQITGVKELKRKLTRLTKQYGKVEDVVVGFTQNYALYVHEIPANHIVGNDQYLLGPARRMHKELGQVVEDVTANTFSLQHGLLAAGYRLQRAAQDEVPVETGALKASAFTAKESELNAASAAAWKKGEEKRASASPKSIAAHRKKLREMR